MKTSLTTSRSAAELAMLTGAAVAPFNAYFQFHIGGLPLLIWGFFGALVVIAVYRWEVVDAIDGPVLALWAMLPFIVLSTAFATPAEYKPYGIADVAGFPEEGDLDDLRDRLCVGNGSSECWR